MLYNLFMDYEMRGYMERFEAEEIKFLQLKYRIRSTTREESTTENIQLIGQDKLMI